MAESLKGLDRGKRRLLDVGIVHLNVEKILIYIVNYMFISIIVILH